MIDYKVIWQKIKEVGIKIDNIIDGFFDMLENFFRNWRDILEFVTYVVLGLSVLASFFSFMNGHILDAIYYTVTAILLLFLAKKC